MHALQFLNAAHAAHAVLNWLSVPPGMDTLGFSSLASSIAHVNPLVKISIGSSGTQRAMAVAVLPDPETPWYSAAAASLPSPQ